MIESFILIIVLLSAMVIHEYAHAWVAYKLGDPTAKTAGRLSLNPLRHIDFFGTFLLPCSLLILKMFGIINVVFAYAKAVPVNFLRLNNPKRDMIFVGLAGPFVNIAVAFIFMPLLKIDLQHNISELIGLIVLINMLLAIFNLIPIPPLDGSRLIMGILPDEIGKYYAKLEPYGIFIVVALLWLGPLNNWIYPLVDYLANITGVKLI